MASTKKPAPKRIKKTVSKPKASVKKAAVSTKSRRLNLNLISLKKILLLFLAALAVAAAGIFWYYRIYTDPQKIFWGMVDNNLSTAGFSKETSQESGTFLSSEVNQVSFTPNLGVISLRDITDSTQQPPTRIKLEAIGMPDADYQHYLLIDRPGTEGKPKPDYSKVYGMWLKSDSPQLINSNLFGPILLGNINGPLKKSVMSDLKKAYSVNLSSVKKMNLDGRRAYSFDVEVKLSPYASAAQKYARGLGLAVADQIDPKSYSADDKTNVTVYVDALSRQIRRVHYKSGNNFDNYTGYGIVKKINAPSKTVSSEEFQNAINSVSQE